MSLISAGINALSIFEENSGTIFQLDGKNISPQSTLEFPRLLRKNAKGGHKEIAKQVELTIKHADASLHASLDGADHDVTQWQFAIAGFGFNAVCYEENTFTVEETPQIDPESTDYPFTINYNLSSGTKIAFGHDLIALANRAAGLGFFEDADYNGLADGFEVSSVDTTTFSGGTQTLSDAAGDGYFVIEITFPISGIDVTIAADYANVTGDDVSQRITFTDENNALVSTTQSTGVGDARHSLESTVPAGAFYIKVYFEEWVQNTGGSRDISQPSVRVGSGKTSYVGY